MGASSFVHVIKARTPQEGFSNLKSEAISNYGDNSYNGTISTCDLGRMTKQYAKFKEENVDDAYDHVDEMGGGFKWTADYIDLGESDEKGYHYYMFYGFASE